LKQTPSHPARIDGSIPQPLNGDPATLAVDRALGELRRGRVLRVEAPAQAGVLRQVVAAAETLRDSVLQSLRGLAGAEPVLAVTAERATALGIASQSGVAQCLSLPANLGAAQVALLAGAPAAEGAAALAATLPKRDADAAQLTAIALARHAGLLPAAVCVMPAAPVVLDTVLGVTAADVARFELPLATDLERVSDAHVPLEGIEDSELVVFRDSRNATEHLAVILGNPDRTQPVRVRMHSSCLTGDLLGSLRCDCGDQLQRAVQQLSGPGGGVLLYLSQEGRGIGLASKLRAYRLQDAGLDTLDANHHLGFQADERSFDMAAHMLRALGVPRIRLLTSNPHKVSALREAGIDVVEQEPLHGRVNPHNARYLRIKEERAGHVPRDPAKRT
jgi:GTP cyclohydrolase II